MTYPTSGFFTSETSELTLLESVKTKLEQELVTGDY